MEFSPSLFHTMDEIIDIISYEPRVVEHGFKPDVERIVEILQCSNSESIKISATCILALSGLHKCESEIINKAIQVLVDLVRAEIITNRALCTLIRLASVFPEHAITIVEKNAIDVAFNVVTNCKGDFETSNCVATLLVLVCQVELSPDKERVVLAILDKLIQTKCHLDHHIVRACDALQYRSFKKHVELEEQAFKRIIALISHSNEKVASSALGVVGNIARWGTVDQVQSLAQDSEFLKCLGRTMRGKPEEFLKEACQIILHISAAQGGTFIRAAGEAGLIDNLCSLLEVAESDVKIEVACAKFDIKMEAACAIYNCIKSFL